MVSLGFDLQFSDLYKPEGLKKVDAAFLGWLAGAAPDLGARLADGRDGATRPDAKQESQLLVDLAPCVDDFMGELFGIRPEIAALSAQHQVLAPLFDVKRQFVQRRIARAYDPQSARAIDGETIGTELQTVLGQPVTGIAAFEL